MFFLAVLCSSLLVTYFASSVLVSCCLRALFPALAHLVVHIIVFHLSTSSLSSRKAVPLLKEGRRALHHLRLVLCYMASRERRVEVIRPSSFSVYRGHGPATTPTTLLPLVELL